MKNPIQDRKGSDRVLRGGYWDVNPKYVRSSNRGFIAPTYQYDGLGFRIVRNKV